MCYLIQMFFKSNKAELTKMTCSYCAGTEEITREHITPKFIYEFIEESGTPSLDWNGAAQRLISAEAKIKDVCWKCNNGVLASLDAYGKSFMKDNGLLTNRYLKKECNLVYNYDLLARWLMKVSFNSARSMKMHAEFFEPFKDYILTGLKPDYKFDLYASLLKPVEISTLEKSTITFPAPLRFFEGPFNFRIGQTELGFLAYGICARAIQMSSITILIAIPNETINNSLGELPQISFGNTQIKRIDPASTNIKIKHCNRNWIDATINQKRYELEKLGHEEIMKAIERSKKNKK